MFQQATGHFHAVEPLKIDAPFGWVGDAGSCLAVVGRAGAARPPEIKGYGRRKYRSGGAQGGFQHRSCNGRGRCPSGKVPFLGGTVDPEVMEGRSAGACCRAPRDVSGCRP